ncbi:glycosyltransferase [Chryseobacterium hagamense]|uniref:Glycosyl transferase n=1 Tax=Chryseobacterium hagamense TaxID=395935 RepID=A0A511YLV7_9FLAO|nr:glycosyltransferase [Chryseobacterium hagamense]GEN76150.1 glycosyl transferase [Chryseobacterium hagamense]
MKTKVVHITQGFGGLFTYIKQIVKKIDYEQFELEIIAPENQECRIFCEEHSIPYTVISLERGFNPFKDFIGLLKLYNFLKKTKPDLIHVHSAKAGFLGRIAGKLAGIKSIYTPHGISYLGFTGVKRTVFFSLEVFAKKYTAYVLACSESEKIRCRYEVGIPEEKIKVIPNSIEVNTTLPQMIDSSAKLHIGTVARLTYAKNPVLFVEIANRIKQIYPYAEFSVLGAGFTDDLKPEFLAAISKYNLEESFAIHEWGSFQSVEQYLKTLDIFLMPSIFEGLPFALLEAVNENVLCITSKCDGCCVVINNNENGFSCMELDDYVAAIKKAVHSPQLSYDLRLQAKKDLQEKYNADHFIINLQNYYLSVKN